jgi:hypothetical protein
MVYCCMSMGQVAFDQALLYWQSYQLACILKGRHDGESSGADRVLEETVTRHTSCSKSSRHFPFIYSFSFIDKCADDAEHHFWANALQPGTAAKAISFFFLFASSTLTWERDLVSFAPTRPHQRPENVNVQLICHILQQFCLNFVTRVCQFIIFFSLQNSGSKIKHIVANSLNVDTDKKLLSETISCIQFVWNSFQVL